MYGSTAQSVKLFFFFTIFQKSFVEFCAANADQKEESFEECLQWTACHRNGLSGSTCTNLSYIMAAALPHLLNNGLAKAASPWERASPGINPYYPGEQHLFENVVERHAWSCSRWFLSWCCCGGCSVDTSTTNILRMVVAVLVLVVVVVLVAAVYRCFLCFFQCLGRAVLASCNTVCTSSAKQPTIDRDGFKSLPYWLQNCCRWTHG